MYKNEKRNENKKESGRQPDLALPKLPPLVTRSSFLESPTHKIHRHHSSVITHVTHSNSSPLQSALTSSPKHSEANIIQLESNTHILSPSYQSDSDTNDNRLAVSRANSIMRIPGSRRPPPPPLPNELSLSPRSPVTSSALKISRKPTILNSEQSNRYSTNSTSTAVESDVLSKSVNSTFTTEPLNNSPSRKLYDFTNDSSSTVITPITSNSKNNFKNSPSPSPHGKQSTLLSKNISPVSTFGSSLQNSVNFYKRPPPSLGGASNSRTTSGTSKVSGSIESVYSDSNYTFNNSNARHSSFNSLLGGRPLDMVPSITTPTQPFSITFLDENKLFQCYAVHRLSDVYEWILKVYFEWFNEFLFGKIEFFKMVQLLLEFQLPKNFEQDTIDSNVDQIIQSLLLQNAVRFESDEDTDSEITIIVSGLDVGGVFTELLPCYSYCDSKYADTDEVISSTLCYSKTCLNRMSNNAPRQKIKLSQIINTSVGLWTDYWKLTSQELQEINPREVQRQSFIFDLIILEERSLNMANAAIEIYGQRYHSDLLPDEPDFEKLAFDVFRPLIELHKEYLLTPIFWKLKTKGKFIDAIGKTYLTWCHEAKNIYLNYATSMAIVHDIIAWEKQHHTKFASWLKEIDNSPEISRSKMYHDVIFFGGFFKSLQNLPVTLNSVLKNTDPTSEDYEYLKLAITEIEHLSAAVDKAHGASSDHRKLMRFSRQLVFHSSTNTTVGYVNLVNSSEASDSNISQDRLDLGLQNPERRLINAGSALKKRDIWIDPVPVYIALLDNYFLITELVVKGSQKKYKLIERPIPIDYLSLEQRKKESGSPSLRDTIQKELKNSNQLVTTPISAVRPHIRNAANTVSKTIHSSTSNTKNSREHTLSNGSIESANENNSSHQFSFKVRNTATNESFTFHLKTEEEKDHWLKSFMTCFKHCNQKLSSHIFKFEILSTQFAYFESEAPVNLPIATEGSEIDKALKIYEKKFKRYSQSEALMLHEQTSTTEGDVRLTAGSQYVKPTTIFCAEHFIYEGKKFYLVATEYGVLMKREDNNSGKFIHILQIHSVKRMEVNIKLGLLFILEGKKLCYFSLTSILAAYYDPGKYIQNGRLIGISVADKVGWFKFAEDFGNSRHLFYERKGNIVLLTPEFDRITKLLKYFKFYKEYKISIGGPGLSLLEIQDIAIFKKCFIVSTTKGVVLFHEHANDEGIFLPSFLNDEEMYFYANQSHIGTNPFKSKVETSSKKNSSKEKMAEYVKKDISNGKTKPIACFKLEHLGSFIIVYDETVVLINSNGQLPNWKKDMLVLDFYCTGVSLYENYLILASDNMVQIYDLNDTNLCLQNLAPIQLIKSKKVQLVSSDNTSKPVVILSHPHIANRQLLLVCDVRR